MAFLIDIDTSTPDSILTTTVTGLMLQINGVDTPVPLSELSNIELDDEDIETATVMYVTYGNVDYSIDLPDKDSSDFYDVREIMFPE